MSRDDQALAGQLVGGRYRLISPVGRGGIGTVWRVRDETRGVELALKLVPTVDHRGMPSPNKVGRFIREAQALIKLKSPYVVEVYDQGAWRGPDEEDFVYLTMELLQGEPLRERLRREGRLDARVTMRILSHVGRALALAHARGIVHRDLKPANIFLTGATDKPVSKVLDFGLVKSVAAPLATIDPVHTEHGRPLGTPYYMSPEQARGLDTVDHRSDLWALGVIAFECLTGTRPFTGQSVATVFSKIAQGDIPLPSQHGDVPPGFDAWFTKAVERDVQQRFQSTRILIDELREVLVDATTLSRSLHGTLAATLSDLSQSGATMTFLGDRTLRIDRSPTQGASFVGRKEQLSLIDEAIASHCRVINLVGTRGVGRTRLARRWAESRSPEFPGGVWLCSLDHARDADGMWRQIAATLGLRSSDRQPIQRLGRALSSMGRVLLVLERIEAVRQPLAATLAQLLHLAPQALVVVTSDAPLSLPTERVLKVSSLSYPPIGEIGDLETLKRYESVELLLRRVMAFDRSILMSPDPPAIAEVARKTGGSPLAIELLAGQARGRSMAAIAQELDQVSLHLGGTQVMDAEMVLRNTVRWAMSQLTVAAQTALVQLGVFRGRFTLAAAEAAVDLRHLADAPAVADLVETLAARGFLRVGRDVAGDTRYDLHPVIHDVVGEQLDRATLADGSRLRLGVEERHGRYFAVLGQEAALEALHERGGFIRRARYLEDAEDVATAAERALARNDVEIGVACAMAASAVEALLGRFAKASQRLVAPANAPEVGARGHARCRIAQGVWLIADGRYDAARRLLTQALSDAEAAGDGRLAAAARRALAQERLAMARYDEAAALADEARAASDRHGDRTSRADAACLLAECARVSGDLPLAKRRLQEASLVYEELGARARRAQTLRQIAEVEVDLGRYSQAFGAILAALTLFRELGDRHAEAEAMGRQGEIELLAGDLPRATSALDHAMRRARELGACDLEGRFLAITATTRFAGGDHDGAWDAVVKAEYLLRSDAPHGSFDLAEALTRRAHIELARRAHDTARATAHQVHQILADLGPPPVALRRQLVELHHGLGLSLPTFAG